MCVQIIYGDTTDLTRQNGASKTVFRVILTEKKTGETLCKPWFEAAGELGLSGEFNKWRHSIGRRAARLRWTLLNFRS